MKIINVILIFVFILTNAIDLMADMAIASDTANMAKSSLAAIPRFKIVDVTNFYKTEQKKRKLNADEENILTLSTTAADVFSVSEVQYHNMGSQPGTQKERMVDARSIATEIQNKIKQRPNWDPTLSLADLEKVQKISGHIKEILGENSYAWAWVTYQTGDKNAAKEMMNKLFEAEYTSTMAMKNIRFKANDPILESTTLSNVLTPLSTPAENKDRESKLKKMKIHVSNLPNLQIMT